MARTPEEIKARKSEYMRNYVRDPEKAAARAAYMKAYTADPENKARKLSYDKAYRADPEKLAERLAYRTRPEIKARDAETARKRRNTSEDKEKQIVYSHRPDRVLRRKELARLARQAAPEKTRIKSRNWRSGLRGKLNLLKSARPCYDCGGIFPPECLDWDHLPGAEKCFTIGSQAQNHTFEAVINEISKCQLVCACCHRTRTFNRGRKGAK